MDHGEIGAAAAAFWRVALAAPFFLVWMKRQARVQQAGPRRSALWLCVPGVIFAADLVSWHASFHYTSVGISTLLANFAIVIVAVIGWLWFKERLSWHFPIGAALALVGVAGVLGADLEHRPGAIKGDALALLTAAFYASYILCMKQLRLRFTTATLMFGTTACAAVVLAPWAMWTEPQLMPSSMNGWIALVALAGVAHCGGQGLITFGLAYLPASFSAVTLLIQPLGATLLGWLILGQELTGWQSVGGAVVLVGILLAQRGARPTPRSS
jgi:drug/metabolite transporter (DMT)-like permease